MGVNQQLRTSEGSFNSPFRTRGAFDPNATLNAAASNLPVAGDYTVSPSEGLAVYDSFTVVASFTFSSLAAGSQTVAAGDRLVYTGAAVSTSQAGWISVPESSAYGANVQIIAQRYNAFNN